MQTKLSSAQAALGRVFSGKKPNLTKHLNFWHKTLKLLAEGCVCHQPSAALLCFHGCGTMKEFSGKLCVHAQGAGDAGLPCKASLPSWEMLFSWWYHLNGFIEVIYKMWFGRNRQNDPQTTECHLLSLPSSLNRYTCYWGAGSSTGSLWINSRAMAKMKYFRYSLILQQVIICP